MKILIMIIELAYDIPRIEKEKTCLYNLNKQVFVIIAPIADNKMFQVMAQFTEGEIWKPLYKTDGARSGRNGSGLGLSIIKKILDANKWKGSISTQDNLFEIKVKIFN